MNCIKNRAKRDYLSLRSKVLPGMNLEEIEDWQQKATGIRYVDNWDIGHFGVALRKLRSIVRARQRKFAPDVAQEAKTTNQGSLATYEYSR